MTGLAFPLIDVRLANELPWFEANPARLHAELDALKSAGIDWQEDKKLRQQGKLRLCLTVPVGDRTYHLTAEFPDFYPKFRPLVFSNAPFSRHYHPATGNLCLLPRGTRHWYPDDDTLAKLLAEQFPKLVRIHNDPLGEHARAVEQQQGEPFTDYYPYEPGTVVGVDDLDIPTSQEGGWLLLGIEKTHPLRAAVLEVRSLDKKTTIAKANASIRNRYQRSQQKWFRWKRLQEEPSIFDPEHFWKRFNSIRQSGAELDVLGVLFREEVAHGTYGDGWVFIYQNRKRSKKGRGADYYFARAIRCGEATLRERIKPLQPLADKKIVLLGLGALGSSAAWQFARAGVGELRVVDFDFIDHGPTVRTAFGWNSLGMGKVDAARAISSEYPYTNVIPCPWHIGDPRIDELSKMRTVLNEADLVFDATAEEGVQDLFSAEAQRRGIPYIWVSATPGAWGGVTGRGCWHCYQWFVDDGAIPWPNQEAVPDFQPVGCADTTFSGAGFDMTTFTLHGIRLAASTLCSGAEKAYPEVDWDVAVINLRDARGYLIEPEFQHFVLQRHKKCTQHVAR